MLGGPGAPRYPITDQRLLIGRAEQSDIALFEPTVSRRHAAIRLVDGDVFLEDLGSKHGTFVNSRRISNTSLRVGDIVVFGLSLVLRLEASREPVPPVEPLKVPSTVPTAVHSLDEQYITAVREDGVKPAPREDGFEEEEITGSADLEKLQDQLARARQLAEAGALCASLIPEAVTRMTELRAGLERAVAEGEQRVDPYPILASLESIAEVLDQLADAARGQPERLLASPLLRAVQSAVSEVEPKVTPRGVHYLVQVPKRIKVRADVPLLTRALTWYLEQAGCCSREGNPVEILASEDRGQVVVTISHLGQPLPGTTDSRAAGPVVGGFYESRDIIKSFGGKVAVEAKPGVGTTVRISLPIPPA